MYVKAPNGIKKAEKSITIENLFCMTAGFSYELDSPMIKKCKEDTNGRCQTRELMKYLAKEPLLFAPGEHWEYSLCHDVLAAFVEVISGMRFGKFIEECIFKPLGNDNITDFGWGGAAGAYLLIDTKNEITAFYAQHVLHSPVTDFHQELPPIILQEALK